MGSASLPWHCLTALCQLPENRCAQAVRLLQTRQRMRRACQPCNNTSSNSLPVLKSPMSTSRSLLTQSAPRYGLACPCTYIGDTYAVHRARRELRALTQAKPLLDKDGTSYAGGSSWRADLGCAPAAITTQSGSFTSESYKQRQADGSGSGEDKGYGINQGRADALRTCRCNDCRVGRSGVLQFHLLFVIIRRHLRGVVVLCRHPAPGHSHFSS